MPEGVETTLEAWKLCVAQVALQFRIQRRQVKLRVWSEASGSFIGVTYSQKHELRWERETHQHGRWFFQLTSPRATVVYVYPNGEVYINDEIEGAPRRGGFSISPAEQI